MSDRVLSSLAMACLLVFAGSTLGGGKKDEKKLVKTETKKEGLVIQDSLTTADALDPVRMGRYSKVHLFEMSPGKTYIIELHDVLGTRWDPYLRLEDSGGRQLAENDDGAGNLNSRITFTPTKTETFRIVATTCNPGLVGTYRLTVVPVSPGTPLPVTGSPSPMTGGFIPTLPATELGDIVITPLPTMGYAGERDDSSTHGYLEYRFSIENRSETQGHVVNLTVPRWRNRYRSGGTYLSALRKTVTVGTASTVEVSLFQPDLPLLNGGEAQVTIDGKDQERGISLASQGNRGSRFLDYGYRHHMYASGGTAPSIPVLTSRTLNAQLSTDVYKSAVGGAPSGIGYSGSRGVRSGTYPVQGPHFGKPFTYVDVHRFTVAPEIPSWSKNWLGYSSFAGVALTGEELQAAPVDVRRALWQFVECGGTLLVVGDCKLPESWQRSSEKQHGFKVHYASFGQCVVTEKQVAEWDPDSWRVVTGALEQGTKPWNNVRTANDAHSMFPVVENIGIPVRGMFFFMLMFVVLIGPVNFMWLSRTRRRIWLLWTVPVFSLLTCAILAGYMIVSEGWHGHVRAEGVTVLDEVSQRAATVAWLGYYTPTTPGGGLHFDNDTELTPHFLSDSRYGQSRDPCTMDWTEDQHLDTGWVLAKVPSHFLVRRSEKRLERVLVRRQDDKPVAAVNSLKADIQTIWVAGADGAIYSAENVAAGAEAHLTPATVGAKASAKREVLRDNFAGDWLKLMEALEKRPGDFLRPGCYIAVLYDAPFLEQGLRHAQTRKMKSIVYGIMKE